MASFQFSLTLYVYLVASISPLICSADYQSIISAERICKPGPPLKASPGKTNCLVIGDSISIGYTPWVAKMLGDGYQVQHAPWDVRGGGALDSKYGLQCLHILLRTAMLEPTNYNIIIFNFGFHDCCEDNPEDYTEPVEYAENLKVIKSILLSTGAKVGFVFTTPVPYNVTLNNRAKFYNSIASDVMKKYPTVAIADLYTWVIKVCGEPPYESCAIAAKQPSPHYTQQGYKYLNERVKDLVLDLAEGINENPRVCNKQEFPRITRKYSIPCKNRSGKVVTVCPYNSTCCDSLFSSAGQGCCLNPNAFSCRDGKHCCPAGYECGPGCSSQVNLGVKCSCRRTY